MKNRSLEQVATDLISQVLVHIAVNGQDKRLGFMQYADGVEIKGEYDREDLIVCIAVLRDLADALETKRNLLTN